MKRYRFTNIDGIMAENLESTAKRLLESEILEVGEGFDQDSYVWIVGRRVWDEMKRLSAIYYSFHLGIRDAKWMGIGIEIAPEKSESSAITLRKKTPNERMPYTIYERHLRIKKVIFNDPATIVYWPDGTKTVVKAEGEAFDPEKGLAMAIAKKAFGNKGNYYDVFREWLPKEEKIDTEQEQLLEKEDNDNTEILTAKQLAEKTGWSVSTVLRDCRRGFYPGAMKVDGKWLIPYSGLVGGSKNDN